MTCAVHLHGRLGRLFAPRYDLSIDSPAEAIRALTRMVAGFRDALAEGAYRVVRGRLGVPVEGLAMRMGACRELHIIPAAAGAKNSGTSKIVIGVVLIAAAIVTAGAAIADAPATGSFAAGTGGVAGGVSGVAGASAVGIAGIATVGQLAFIGVGMVLTGASMLLSAQPKSRGPLTVDQNPSFMFSGPVNTNAQGGPVPLVYGTIRVGSVVGAASLKSEDYVANPASETLNPGVKSIALRIFTSVRNAQP